MNTTNKNSTMTCLSGSVDPYRDILVWTGADSGF